MSCKHGNWSPCDECDAEDALYASGVAAGKNEAKDALFDVETTRFLTDVLTAAGLLYHGKTDKGLAQRISDGQARLRDKFHAPNKALEEPNQAAAHKAETLDEWTDRTLSSAESDPNGKSPHEAGAKLDAGKNRCGLVLLGFARALQEVSRVGTYGANKYTDNGWVAVPNGEKRYTDAMLRHLLREAAGEECDPDTDLLHAAHAAWNALARLDLLLREKETKS